MEPDSTFYFCRTCNAMCEFLLATLEDGSRVWLCEECNFVMEFNDDVEE